ncbi:MAG: antitoxin VbhA family protein [Terracidiphilus sp.]
MATTVKSQIDVLDRHAAVNSVLASFGMEGLSPDPVTKALLEQYSAGAISLEEFGAAIELHVARMAADERVAHP